MKTWVSVLLLCSACVTQKTYEALQRSVNECSRAARDEALQRVAAAEAAKGG